MHPLVYATLIACFAGAHTGDYILVRGDSATVIQWLNTHRDALMRQTGVRVLRREGNMVTVAKDGFYVRLQESGKRWGIFNTERGIQYFELAIDSPYQASMATYHMQLAAAHRKLRTWTTDITVQPYTPGWTWITFSVQASVIGPGEARLQSEIDAAVDRMKASLRSTFR